MEESNQTKKLRFKHGSYLMHHEYLALQERIKKGQKFMEGKFFDPAYANEAELYNALAVQALEYEIANDLLPI